MSRNSRATTLVLALVVAGGLTAAPWFAEAGHMHVNDPKDTPGPLDVRRIDTGGRLLEPWWRVTTFSRWRAARIFERGFFVIHLDLRGDDFFEHYVLIRSKGNRLRADLYRDRRNGPGDRKRRVAVWRRNEKSFTIRFPIASLLGESRTRYRWYATSLMTSNRCPDVCIDRIPDEGAVVEPLVPEPPEPEPSPTPQPTP